MKNSHDQHRFRRLMPLGFLLTASFLAGVGCSDKASPTTVDFIGLRIEEVGAHRAVVRFRTSEPTTCEAEFGVDPENLDRRATDPSMGPEFFQFDHEVPLEDLEPATHYHLRARAQLLSGELFYSQLYEFTTDSASTGNLVNFALPEHGTTVLAVSSNFGGAANDETWGADYAIDGQMSTQWSSSGDGDEAWISFDFGQQRRLTRFEIRSRQMPDGTAIARSIQLIFDDGEPIGPFDTPDPALVYGFDLAQVDATIVRVEVVTSSGGNTGLREIRFLGPQQ